MQKCLHCGKRLSAVPDAYCGECRHRLDGPSETATPARDKFLALAESLSNEFRDLQQPTNGFNLPAGMGVITEELIRTRAAESALKEEVRTEGAFLMLPERKQWDQRPYEELGGVLFLIGAIGGIMAVAAFVTGYTHSPLHVAVMVASPICLLLGVPSVIAARRERARARATAIERWVQQLRERIPPLINELQHNTSLVEGIADASPLLVLNAAARSQSIAEVVPEFRKAWEMMNQALKEARSKSTCAK